MVETKQEEKSIKASVEQVPSGFTRAIKLSDGRLVDIEELLVMIFNNTEVIKRSIG